MDNFFSSTHGARPPKYNGRKRKGASDYAAEHQEDFTSKAVLKGGRLVNVLVCKFCSVIIGARSDRIKEHLASKRHTKLKRDATEGGRAEMPVNNACSGSSTTNYVYPCSSSGRSNYGDLDLDALECGDVTTNNSSSTEVQIKYSSSGSKIAASIVPDADKALPDVNVWNGKLANNQRGFQPSAGLPQLQRPAALPESKYCLKWDKYVAVIKDSLKMWQMEGLFTDVTLASDGKIIKCHKFVLSACSDYFSEILKDINDPCQHPIIILKDTPSWQLDALVHFFYHGELHVKKEDIVSLLQTAGQLGVRGLTCTPTDYLDDQVISSINSNIRQNHSVPLLKRSTKPATTISTASSRAEQANNNEGKPFNTSTSQCFPYLGTTSGGVCHEPGSKSLNTNSTPTHSLLGLDSHGITNGFSQNLTTKYPGHLSVPLSNSIVQQEYSNKPKIRKRRFEISGPQITIKKLVSQPDQTTRSRLENNSAYDIDADGAIIDWTRLIPKVEMTDSFENGINPISEIENLQDSGVSVGDNENDVDNSFGEALNLMTKKPNAAMKNHNDRATGL